MQTNLEWYRVERTVVIWGREGMPKGVDIEVKSGRMDRGITNEHGEALRGHG